ncbi:hypothetical protein, partial [Scytonema sp. PRP1]|uniref:hypothetical protein n=1 Tax=Scytonema sp. PRP1 TaxID=3120513 RepID=UPI002FD04316
LLTISVPLGLQFGANPKEIQVNGPGHEFSYEEKIVEYSSGSKSKEPAPLLNTSVVGLNVEVGKTLALVGGMCQFRVAFSTHQQDVLKSAVLAAIRL